MRKALLYIVSMLCVAFSACEGTIEELVYTDDKNLAVFGILNTAGTANRIYCYYMDGKKIHPISDAKIKIYVNGSLAEEVKEFVPGNKFDTYDPDWYYWFSDGWESGNIGGDEFSYDDVHKKYDNKLANYLVETVFKPGDKVRLEVSSASCNRSVWAETEVPQPAEASVIDTLFTYEEVAGSYGPNDYYKVGLKIKANKPGNYRLLSGFCVDEKYGIATVKRETFEKVEDFPDSCLTVQNISLEVKDDIALTDGRGYFNDDDDEMISMDTYYYNHFRIVAGEYFNGGEYNASFFVSPLHYYDIPTWRGYSVIEEGFLEGHKYKVIGDEILDPGMYYGVYGQQDLGEGPDNGGADDEPEDLKVLYDKEHAEYIYYQVFSMPEDEFRYLKMRSSQVDVDYADSPFIEPVVLKSNINGGLGIFAIEAVTEGKIELKSPIVKSPVYNYK